MVSRHKSLPPVAADTSADVHRIYVAAPWVRKEEAKYVAGRLNDAGFVVTSRWIDMHGGDHDPVVLRREAQHDWDDIRAATVLVVLNIEKSEGKATEQGIALERGLKIVGVGIPKNNVFHYLPQYRWVASVVELINLLNSPDF